MTKEWSLKEMVVGTNSNGQMAIEVGYVGQEKKVSINCNHILIYQCAFPFHYYSFDLHHYWLFVLILLGKDIVAHNSFHIL